MTKQLTHWKKTTNPKYLGSYELQPGEDLIVTIKAVKVEKIQDPKGATQEKPVAYFKETGIKPMILNVTNCKTIAMLAGSPYIEDWQGVSIQLFSATISVAGEQMEALRIRPFKPQAKKELLTLEHPRFPKALEALKNFQTDLEQIKSIFDLSPEAEKAFMAVINGEDTGEVLEYPKGQEEFLTDPESEELN